jgi:hypothetical protein
MEKIMLEYGHQLNRHLPILKLAEYMLRESKNPRTARAKAFIDENQAKL